MFSPPKNNEITILVVFNLTSLIVHLLLTDKCSSKCSQLLMNGYNPSHLPPLGLCSSLGECPHPWWMLDGNTCRTRTSTSSRQLRCRSSGCRGSGALRKGRSVELRILALALLTTNVEVLWHRIVERATSQERWGSGRPGLISPQSCLGRHRPRSLLDLKQNMYAL